jgi:hypothetical protein
MCLRRFLLPSLTALVFAAAALTAHAQSGPIGGSKSNQTGPVSGPVAKALTPDKLVALLQARGHKADLKTFGNVKVVFAHLEADGWQYDVEIQFSRDGKTYRLETQLTAAGQAHFTAAQLTALMHKNHEFNGTAILSIDPQTGRLVLTTANHALPRDETEFNQLLNKHLENVRAVFPLFAPAAQ